MIDSAFTCFSPGGSSSLALWDISKIKMISYLIYPQDRLFDPFNCIGKI